MRFIVAWSGSIVRSVTSPLMKYLPSGDTRKGIDCLFPLASTSSTPLFQPGTSDGWMPLAFSVMPGVTLFVKNSSMRFATSSGFAAGTGDAAGGLGVEVGGALQETVASSAPPTSRPAAPAPTFTEPSFRTRPWADRSGGTS